MTNSIIKPTPIPAQCSTEVRGIEELVVISCSVIALQSDNKPEVIQKFVSFYAVENEQ